MPINGYFRLYHGNATYEPSWTLYRNSLDPDPVGAIENVATAFAALLQNTWAVTRWEYFNTLNQLVTAGDIDEPGGWTGEVMNYKYCNCIKLSSDRVGGVRSIKYVHGVPENAFGDGTPVSSWLLLVENLATVLEVNQFLDTTGLVLKRAEFTTVSKRRRVRRR